MSEAVYSILIPFLGTSLGSALVFFMRGGLSDKVQRALTGFAAGVMVAASVWSLLIPSIEQSSAMGQWAFVPAAVGFWVGVLFLLLLDHVIPHLHRSSEQAEGPKSRLHRNTMMMLAVTLHNIPEGIAISVPVYYATNSRVRGALYALLSGLAEPAGALLAFFLLRSFISPLFLNGLIATIAGIMIYVSISELIPEGFSYGRRGYTVGGLVAGILAMSVGIYLV